MTNTPWTDDLEDEEILWEDEDWLMGRGAHWSYGPMGTFLCPNCYAIAVWTLADGTAINGLCPTCGWDQRTEEQRIADGIITRHVR